MFGYYKPSTDSLNVNLELSRIEVNYLAGYFPDMLKGGEGAISGNLVMKGTTQKGFDRRFLEMDSVSLTVAGIEHGF